MSRIKRRLASCGGFTFTEMLACVIILILAGGVVTQTLDLGIRNFKERTRDSEAELLCNNISVAVQERLTYAHKPNGGKFQTGADGLDGIECQIVTIEEDDTVQARGLAALDYGVSSEIASKYYLLVSPQDYALDQNAADRAFDAAVAYPLTSEGYQVTVTIYDHGTDHVRAEKIFTVKPVLNT